MQPTATKRGRTTDAIDDSAAKGSCTVFVKNLPFRVTEDEMYAFFEDCGEVLAVRLATDRETGRAKGFGHVQFGSTQAAAKAIAKSSQSLQGRELYIDSAEERGSGGGGAGHANGSGREFLLNAPQGGHSCKFISDVKSYLLSLGCACT